MILPSGYATQYKLAEVRERAQYAASAISDMVAETGATSVVVHGNSGVSCGFAALMLSAVDFNIVLLRKDNDNSHGSPIEGPEGHRLGRYIILDDFVATGTTMNRIRDKIATLSQQYGVPYDAPECVGIVLYGYTISDRFKFSDGHTVPARGRG
jgi:orotate phosphoribosyltransferase-like protein